VPVTSRIWIRKILHAACWNGHADTVELLLALDDRAHTQSHEAHTQSYADRLQLNKGSELRGCTALLIAAQYNRRQCVSLLIAKNADVNQPSDEGSCGCVWLRMGLCGSLHTQCLLLLYIRAFREWVCTPRAFCVIHIAAIREVVSACTTCDTRDCR
jgi:hypothetical protein